MLLQMISGNRSQSGNAVNAFAEWIQAGDRTTRTPSHSLGKNATSYCASDEPYSSRQWRIAEAISDLSASSFHGLIMNR